MDVGKKLMFGFDNFFGQVGIKFFFVIGEIRFKFLLKFGFGLKFRSVNV